MDKLKYWIILLFASQSLYALTTLNVTLSTDNNPGGIGEVGDLRYALNTMNQGLSTTPDDYAIVFDSPMTIQLNGILPIINNSSNPVNITIGNPGSTITAIIDGNSGAYSGFFIPMGNVTIQNMAFQNLTAKGGNGGNGMASGGGGMGAGGAIFTPQTFLFGSNPSVTLMNVAINSCSAVGGNGGSYIGISATGNEGGGGGGGFGGNGGSVTTTTGSSGGGGGGGYGGNGGDVTQSTSDPQGGGGGGGGGIGSQATIGTLTNLGNGGSDQNGGQDGNGYGLTVTAGSGGGGLAGGNNAGGGGGGAATGGGFQAGGGGGGSNGVNGVLPQGSIPPLTELTLQIKGKRFANALRTIPPLPKGKAKHDTHGGSALPSGGGGGDGAGAGGGAVVMTSTTNDVDGQAGGGGYGGGGGGGAGTGAFDTAPAYTVQGGSGGVGGGGGGGGVNQSGFTTAEGGGSLGGGGGGGGGPSTSATAAGGTDTGNLGGGAGGSGSNNYGSGFGGGGGGGGSGLGGAIFVDSNLNFTIQAFSGIPTTFDTNNNTTQAGTHGTGGPGATDGTDGSALGNSIFLRTNSSLTLSAVDTNDVLTLGSQVSFADDTSFGPSGATTVYVKGNGTVIYNGTSNYQGNILVNNANFKVNGQINSASVLVCRNISFSPQRGMLSGTGALTGSIFVNSGTISPDTGGSLTLGSLTLSPANAGSNTLGSLVHIDVNSSGTSSVAVTGSATLAGTLEINLDSTAHVGQYVLLTSSGIAGTFDSVTFKGKTPKYTLSYLPAGAPTFVQLNFQGYPAPTPSGVEIPATVNGSPILNPAVVGSGRPIILGALPVPGTGPTTYTLKSKTGNVTCQIGKTQAQTYLKMHGTVGSCTIVGTKDGVTSNPLTVSVP